jgi:hypothetical protein
MVTHIRPSLSSGARMEEDENVDGKKPLLLFSSRFTDKRQLQLHGLSTPSDWGKEMAENIDELPLFDYYLKEIEFVWYTMCYFVAVP